MKSALAPAAALLLALGGCARVVENRVEAALTEAGVPAGMASCMAERWAGRLSVGQIRGIQRFATAVRAEGRQLTIVSLIDHVRSWNDPEALLVVTSSTARCALG